MTANLPLSIGVLHFIGIGGIGMSGIAELMFDLGYTVQGSDISVNKNIENCKDLGIKFFHGQKKKNIKLVMKKLLSLESN